MHYSFHRRSMLALAALPLASAAASAAPASSEVRTALPDEGAPLTAESMVGKVLRVIEPGSAVTMDYSTDRVNIELDANRKIVRVFVG